jgi:hypothetical protein
VRDNRVDSVSPHVTDRRSIEAATTIAADVTLLVSSAGIMTGARTRGDEAEL